MSYTASVAGHRVTVGPLPEWIVDTSLLCCLGAKWVTVEASHAGIWQRAELAREVAADLAERLRGQGFAGLELSVVVDPPLARGVVRGARLTAARGRRKRTQAWRSGVRLDGEGKFSWTADDLALSIGELAEGRSVLDAGCGAGGNTIGFARAGSSVMAVEQDRARIDMAIHNVGIYGVRDQVQFVLGDAAREMNRGGRDILFVDPPWGGESYDRKCFDLSSLSLFQMAMDCRGSYEEVWAKFPASADTRQLAKFPGQLPPVAFFGTGPSDCFRVKFVLIRFRTI